MLRVRITSFNSPFSFFCAAEKVRADAAAGPGALEQQLERWLQKEDLKDEHRPHGLRRRERLHFEYGDYVAVQWHRRWVRAVVRSEGFDVLLWLIDYGEHIKVSDDVPCVNLPQQFKKQPSEIFEASVHGITPASWVVNESSFNSGSFTEAKFSESWCDGALNLSAKLLNEAESLLFKPTALLSTKTNDIVLGNLYLKSDQGITDFNEVLVKRSDYIVRVDAEDYVKNTERFYTSRRIHRASHTNPDFTHNLLKLSLPTDLSTYTAMNTCDALDGETVGRAILAAYRACQRQHTKIHPEKQQIVHALPPTDAPAYCNMSVVVNGELKNLLSVIKDKIEDLNMCEKYKNFDVKYIGRANYRCCTRARHP